MKRARFRKHGALALGAAFFGLEFSVGGLESEPFRVEGDLAIVEIVGPMTHHAEWFWDNYDAIKERVRAAAESPCKAVMLEIDSPGGDCSGCFETARAIRDMAKAAGKPLYAFVDGMAASGGYALASAASQIGVSETAFVGSIGVISGLVDTVAQDRAFGENWAIVASGARKADGHPHTPLTEAAVKTAQGHVDSLAELFFELVAEGRPITVEEVRALEAGQFHGASAVEVGLADVVATKDLFFAMVAKGETASRPPAETEDTMGWKDALKKAAEEGDEDAKKALAALDGEGDKEEKKDEEKTEDAPPPSEKKEDDEKKKEDAAASSLASRVAALESKDAEAKRAKTVAEKAEKEKILSELNVSDAQKTVLRAMPLQTMKNAIDAFAASAQPKPEALTRPPLRGTEQGTPAASIPNEVDAYVDARMGLTTSKGKFGWDRNDRIYPSTLSREEAKATLERNRTRIGG